MTARRELSAAVSTYTGANIGAVATLGTWVNPGAGKVNFKEVDATNLPGIYELHFVDLLFGTADASRWVGGMVQATGVAPSPFEFELDATDAQNATSLGLANLDVAVSSRSTLGGVAQTGDNYARLGAPVGASLSADMAAIRVDTQLVTTTGQTELLAVPASNAAPLAKLNWLFLLARNKITQTSTQQKVIASDGTTVLGTASVSDDATTGTRGAFS